MTEQPITQKLLVRIRKYDFDKIQVGHMTMMGILLSKTDWKAYRKILSKPVLKGYAAPYGKQEPNIEIMWFRGYPLKQK